MTAASKIVSKLAMGHAKLEQMTRKRATAQLALLVFWQHVQEEMPLYVQKLYTAWKLFQYHWGR